MTPELEEYILNHIEPEPPMLKKLNRDTQVQRLYGRMCSGHYQGRILKMLVEMIQPHLILELGTFTGYSALCMAEGMPADCTLHTIEIDDEIEDFTLPRLQSSPNGDRIFMHIGDALDIIPNIPGVFDLVFIDANKRIYTEYFEAVIDRVRTGGYIFADNTLWDGKVTDPDSAHEPQTIGIMKFNDLVASDPRVETVILPLRDGLTIMRKL